MTDPLTTIRQAYRYIAAYERRVLDAVDRVDEVLREQGFERHKPHRWTPLYRSFPSRAYAPEKWIWDNLPNYAMRYMWLDGPQNTEGSRWVFLDHIADTSFEKRQLTERGEPDPLKDLGPVEEGRSILRWHLIEFREALPQKTYNLVWSKILDSVMGTTRADRRITEPTDAPVANEEGPLVHHVHCVDIASLTKPEHLDGLLVDPLIGFLAPRRS